jgi:hypothetical protein
VIPTITGSFANETQVLKRRLAVIFKAINSSDIIKTMPPVTTASPFVSAEDNSHNIKGKASKAFHDGDILKSVSIPLNNNIDDANMEDTNVKWIPDNLREILEHLSKFNK